MKLARAIHFDESDMRVYHSPARTGEWCLSGGRILQPGRARKLSHDRTAGGRA